MKKVVKIKTSDVWDKPSNVLYFCNSLCLVKDDFSFVLLTERRRNVLCEWLLGQKAPPHSPQGKHSTFENSMFILFT